jgi:hypothetical protein
LGVIVNITNEAYVELVESIEDSLFYELNGDKDKIHDTALVVANVVVKSLGIGVLTSFRSVD